MARSLMVGMTDYSHQSLEDMQTDLEDFIKLLNETIAFINSNLDKLEKISYWENFDFDFRLILYNSKKMFETAITEINEVIQGFDFEIYEYHVKMLMTIGKNGSEYYRNYGKIWNNEELNKDYGKEHFKLIEALYRKGRGTSANLMDLQNLANRLKDFVGRKGKGFEKMEKGVTNNFNGSIGSLQQNYDESQGILQNYDKSNNDKFEELKTLISEIKEILVILPDKEKEEVIEYLDVLDTSVNEKNPKANRVKVFANSISDTFRKTVNMKTLENATQISEKLPKIIDGIEKVTNLL